MNVLAVTNMYPSDERPFLGTFVEQQVLGLREIGVGMEVLVLGRAHQGPFVYATQGRAVRNRLQRGQFDLVHVMYGGPMAYGITRTVKDLPVMVSFCGDDLLGSIGPWPLWAIRSWINKKASFRAAKCAQGIVVKSRNLERALPQCVDRAKVRIIPNGIDLSRFKQLDRAQCQSRLGWNRDAFHVLFASNGDPRRKRLGLARAAVEALRDLGVDAVFHAMDKVPHAEVPVWLNASDVLLVTSIHEGSVNVVKEALGCNLPVVSVDVGDVPERLEKIPGCYIADPTPTALADRLKRVVAGARRIDGRPGMEELSLTKIASRLAEFYAEIIENRRSGHGTPTLCVG